MQIPAPQFSNSPDSAQPRLGLRRGSPDAGQVAINPPAQLPVISADAAARALQERFLVNADRGDAQDGRPAALVSYQRSDSLR